MAVGIGLVDVQERELIGTGGFLLCDEGVDDNAAEGGVDVGVVDLVAPVVHPGRVEGAVGGVVGAAAGIGCGIVEQRELGLVRVHSGPQPVVVGHVEDAGHVGALVGVNRLPDGGIAVAAPVVAGGAVPRPGRDDRRMVGQGLPIVVVEVGGQRARALVLQSREVGNRVRSSGGRPIEQLVQVRPPQTIDADLDDVLDRRGRSRRRGGGNEQNQHNRANECRVWKLLLENHEIAPFKVVLLLGWLICRAADDRPNGGRFPRGK